MNKHWIKIVTRDTESRWVPGPSTSTLGHWRVSVCCRTRTSDLWRTLVPTGPRAGVSQWKAATTNTKSSKTRWKEGEGGKSFRLIFPIPHILQILQYNSYVGGEEKKNNKTWYFIKQIIYIDMKNWILFSFEKKNKYNFCLFLEAVSVCCFGQTDLSASSLSWVDDGPASMPR